MSEHRWSIGGINIRVVFDGVRAELATLCLSGTEHLAPPVPGAQECSIRLTPAAEPEATVVAGLVPVRSLSVRKGRVQIEGQAYRDSRENALVVSLGHVATGTVDYAGGRATVLIHDEGYFLSRADPLYTSSVLFKSFLLELLPAWGLYPVHVGACCRDDVCLLIGGEVGSGKSSLLVALLERGFAYLGDELCFVRTEPSGVSVVGFPIHGKVQGPARARIPRTSHRGLSGGAVVFDPMKITDRLCAEARLTHIVTVRSGAEKTNTVEAGDFTTALETLLLCDVFYGTRHHAGQLEAALRAGETASCVQVTPGGEDALEEVLFRCTRKT